nr:pyruvate, phosphate dikinase [Acetatifactor sp.]
MAKKWVYLFTEGNADMRNLLGGKGANLAEMTNIGLPVPQGFTITTEACTQYYEDGREINDEIKAQIEEHIVKMEEITGKKFGDLENPLLVSVRSGARASMPGMMDTILNLGLNEDVVNVIAEKSGNPRWAWDCYRRFIQMYSDVVMEVGKKYFEELIDKMKKDRNVTQDVELTADDLKELANQFKAEYKDKLGTDFPSDPKEQLYGAIKAVFRSWDNPRANVYRRDNDIPYSWGTAVNVQSMAFGNMGDDCGTGVAFTRDPATGNKGLFGEFLTNAQGEDVVAGVRTPMKIAEMADKFPEAFKQFEDVCKILESHYRDMQDMEFTVEHGKLYMLQTRNGKRTAQAALKIACDLVDEGMRTEKEAVAMIDPRNLDTLLHPQFDQAALKAATPIGKGLGASPGAACGKIVFTAEDAEEWAARGERVILVRLETSPEDITGMKAAQGILTVRGGMTSHAAVVARGMGECCVSGCGDIAMDEENKKFTLAGKTFTEGDFISIDGTTGNIYDGEIKTVDATIAGEFGRVMAWADKFRTLKVRTNADTPTDAKKARELGAEGIGLCRTEHMFFSEDRIAAFREMICADTVEEREAALEKILPYQQGDFEKLYEALEGTPVTIRFLDPRLHEFVPQEKEDIEKLAAAQGKSVDQGETAFIGFHLENRSAIFGSSG